MGGRCWLGVIACASMGAGLRAQTFTTIFRFDGVDGFNPGALTLSVDGNFYGTTYLQQGTLFKITPAGVLTTLYTFCPAGYGCLNGVAPDGVLVQAGNGDFYGTTQWGGTYNNGTIYRITPDGALTTLYSFCAQSGCPDGANPDSLVRAADGDYYGTTVAGGTGSYCYFANSTGCGTVFRISPGGEFTTLYSFCSQSACADGAVPSPLIQAADGNFYGTAGGGGSGGLGTFFKITAAGALTTLYSFCPEGGCGFGGVYPSSLIQAADGAFYGTESYGGPQGRGSVFRITRDGNFSTLHSFRCSAAGCPDGEFPNPGLIQASDGNFYGTTSEGGGDQPVSFGGTIFELTPSGFLTTLHVFCPKSCRGPAPYPGIIQAPDGVFYGTFEGGDGSVYSLSLGLGPFVKPQPALGKPGSVIQLLGVNLAGTSSVTFNGTPAVFNILSDSQISTTVPPGATTGKIQVVTLQGVLLSDGPFYVHSRP